jgi:UDP-GlcNAc:undecaprenyl-phosphate GlcNAc-1-phosphate transferase
VGVYRGLWRYAGVNDLWVFAKAVALGSVLSVLAVVLLYRFDGYSRAVFIVDGLILLTLVTASRLAFRLFRALLPMPSNGGRRALIYGAGDAGEMLLREMQNNPNLGCVPVGFADDDPLKKGKVIHGLRVLGGNGSFADICRANNVEEVYISSTTFHEDRVRDIRQKCQEAGVALKRMRMTFETLAGEEAGAAP